MTDRLILTVAATQGPEGAACLAWQLSHGGVQAMGLAHTLPQVLQDVAAAVERDDAAAAYQFTSLSNPNYIMNPTDTEIEKLFRQWWQNHSRITPLEHMPCARILAGRDIC